MTVIGVACSGAIFVRIAETARVDRLLPETVDDARHCGTFRKRGEVGIDTLDAAKKLRAAGFTEPQTDAVVDLLREAAGVVDLSHLAPKEDVHPLATRDEVRAGLAELKADLQRWVVGLVVVNGVVLIGAMLALARMLKPLLLSRPLSVCRPGQRFMVRTVHMEQQPQDGFSTLRNPSIGEDAMGFMASMVRPLPGAKS